MKKRAQLGPYKENENIDFLREGGLGLFLIESLMDEVTLIKIRSNNQHDKVY